MCDILFKDLFWLFMGVFHVYMALVCVSVVASNATVTPWSIVSATVDMTFKNLYESIIAGKYDIIKTSEQLSGSTLLSVSVGQDKKAVMCRSGPQCC